MVQANQRHRERSEAIYVATQRKHGLLPPSLMSYGGQVIEEFIIGPAEGWTRWLLAMTK